MSVVINLEQVSFAYQTNENILQNINLSIKSKEKILITGQSGSGKTTLLHIIGGILKPIDGQIHTDQNVSFIFQFHHLITSLTVLENIAIAKVIKDKCDWKEALEAAKALVSLVDLDARSNYYPIQLSGGEKQRVAIARALITKPAVLLCDEPTGSLDEKRAAIALNAILDLSDKFDVAIVMISHDKSISRFFNKTYKLHNGMLEQA